MRKKNPEEPNRGSRLKLFNQKVQISRDCTQAPCSCCTSVCLWAGHRRTRGALKPAWGTNCCLLKGEFTPLKITKVLMVMVGYVFSFFPFVCFLAPNLRPVSLPLRPTPASVIRPTCSSSAHRHTVYQLHSGLQVLPFCLPLRVGGSEIVLHLFQFCLSTCITTCSWSA